MSERAPENKKRWQDIKRLFLRNHLAVVGLIIVLVIILTAVLAPLIAPYDPAEQRLMDKRHLPGEKYIFGADEYGRDIFSRVIYGTRVALIVALVATSVAFLFGLFFGVLAGYYGGFMDEFIMRLADIVLAFPYLLLAIAIVTILGTGTFNTTLAVGIWGIPSFIRIVRSAVISIRDREYIIAGRALGSSSLRIILKHLIPNFIAPVFVFATLFMAKAIMMEAALSFLGLGVQPPTASWGLMVSSGRNYITLAPHISTMPGLAIVLTVLGFNLLGDGLRDSLDPRMRNI